jgi:hypothetical protein
MLESIPVPLRAILWPLFGTAFILILRRFLPNWLRRTAALAAALASLSALWSLTAGPVEPVTISWEPLNFFRTSPTLLPTSLALFMGITLTGIVATLILGIQGSDPQATKWHGLVLAALAGCLLATMAANLLTLALGSGLLDLALVALVISTADRGDRVVWRMLVPGVASTLLLLFSAVQMDSQIGSASLSTRDFPVEILILLGMAGLLRLLVFPFHPRDLRTPEGAATFLLPVSMGVYLLARVQAIGPVLTDRPWMLSLGGIALLAGGLVAWGSSIGATRLAGTWVGIAMHQTGLALIFVLLLKTSVPWPWLGLASALGILAIWWDSTDEDKPFARFRWLEQLAERTQPWRERVKSIVASRAAFVYRWRESRVGQRTAMVLPVIALISLAGGPLTTGALARWPLYAALLSSGQPGLLIAIFAADTLLAAGLWATLARLLKTANSHRLKLSAVLSMLALAILLVVIGTAPNKLANSLGMSMNAVPNVSVWGLGLIFVLPWLLGAWLARVSTRLERYTDWIQRTVQLEWLFRTTSQAAERLGSVAYWIGMVGEGEGWWGWALIILAIGTLFLTIR